MPVTASAAQRHDAVATPRPVIRPARREMEAEVEVTSTKLGPGLTTLATMTPVMVSRVPRYSKARVLRKLRILGAQHPHRSSVADARSRAALTQRGLGVAGVRNSRCCSI